MLEHQPPWSFKLLKTVSKLTQMDVLLDASLWKKTLSLRPKNALEFLLLDLTMDKQRMNTVYLWMALLIFFNLVSKLYFLMSVKILHPCNCTIIVLVLYCTSNVLYCTSTVLWSVLYQGLRFYLSPSIIPFPLLVSTFTGVKSSDFNYLGYQYSFQ